MTFRQDEMLGNSAKCVIAGGGRLIWFVAQDSLRENP